MNHVFRASAVTETSVHYTGSREVVSRTRIYVVDLGSWNGSVKVSAQVEGMSQLGVTSYLGTLPITNMADGSTIAAGTGITAAGLYEIDLTGLEVQFVHTRVAGSIDMYIQTILG